MYSVTCLNRPSLLHTESILSRQVASHQMLDLIRINANRSSKSGLTKKVTLHLRWPFRQVRLYNHTLFLPDRSLPKQRIQIAISHLLFHAAPALSDSPLAASNPYSPRCQWWSSLHGAQNSMAGDIFCEDSHFPISIFSGLWMIYEIPVGFWIGVNKRRPYFLHLEWTSLEITMAEKPHITLEGFKKTS